VIFPIPVVRVGPIVLQLPGLIVLLGFWAALWVAAHGAKTLGLKDDDVYTPGFCAAVAGILGARAWYVVTHWTAFAGDPLGIASLNLSTLDATGGLVVGVSVGALYAWRKKLLGVRWLDALTPGAALLLAAVSLSNLFSGEAYGSPSTLPWAIELWDMERHPTQIYEMLAMLAILLDAEAPEEQAVTFAAQSTDNSVFLRRCAEVAERLRAGVALTEAVQAIDDTGEFRWRLTNAAHGRGGFMAALSGWHDALDAKAYQLEQAASQVITTGLVIVNGCLVGLIAVGVFQVLTSIVWEVALW